MKINGYFKKRNHPLPSMLCKFPPLREKRILFIDFLSVIIIIIIIICSMNGM